MSAKSKRYRDDQQPFPRVLLGAKAGDLVNVTRDSGSVERRRVTIAPWQLGNGHWVVGLEGIRGGYSLSRCRPIEDTAPAPLEVTRA